MRGQVTLDEAIDKMCDALLRGHETNALSWACIAETRILNEEPDYWGDYFNG